MAIMHREALTNLTEKYDREIQKLNMQIKTNELEHQQTVQGLTIDLQKKWSDKKSQRSFELSGGL